MILTERGCAGHCHAPARHRRRPSPTSPAARSAVVPSSGSTPPHPALDPPCPPPTHQGVSQARRASRDARAAAFGWYAPAICPLVARCRHGSEPALHDPVQPRLVPSWRLHLLQDHAALPRVPSEGASEPLESMPQLTTAVAEAWHSTDSRDGPEHTPVEREAQPAMALLAHHAVGRTQAGAHGYSRHGRGFQARRRAQGQRAAEHVAQIPLTSRARGWPRPLTELGHHLPTTATGPATRISDSRPQRACRRPSRMSHLALDGAAADDPHVVVAVCYPQPDLALVVQAGASHLPGRPRHQGPPLHY